MEQIYTVDEISKYLRLSPIKVRIMLREGKIRASKLERKWLITESAIKEFLAANEQNSTKFPRG